MTDEELDNALKRADYIKRFSRLDKEVAADIEKLVAEVKRLREALRAAVALTDDDRVTSAAAVLDDVETCLREALR